MSVGPSELVVIVLVAFLLFGSRRLADLGKGIGDGIRGFKRGIAGETDDKPGAASPESPKEPKQLTGRVESEVAQADGVSVPTAVAATAAQANQNDPVPPAADTAREQTSPTS